MPSASIAIGTAENDETVSTMSATSRIFRHRATNLRQRIHHAGGGFVMNQSNGVELSRSRAVDPARWIDVSAPFHLQRFGLFSAAPRDIEPFVGERAAHAAKDALADEIADRCFHHAPGRRGRKKNRLLRSEELLQLRMNVAVKAFESFAAMADHRARKGGQVFSETSTGPGMKSLSCGRHRENVPTSNVQRPMLNAEVARMCDHRASLPS